MGSRQESQKAPETTPANIIVPEDPVVFRARFFWISGQRVPGQPSPGQEQTHRGTVEQTSG